MSETIKLIIEIPKDIYESCKNLWFYDAETLEGAVVQGIPLDDVKAEIEKKCDRINSIASVLRYPQHREIQELLCEILNNIGKGDSE